MGTNMSKRHGAVSGFVGGVIFSIMIHRNNQSVFQIRILLSRIWKLPFPLRETLNRTDLDAWATLGFVVFFFPIIAILWTTIGIWFAALGKRQQWNKKQGFIAWILWGISLLLPFIITGFATGYSFRCSDSILVCKAEFLAESLWGVVAGIISGLASALYSSRGYAN
jgi:hypothetical protein